jgi:superoxide reductase
MIYCLQYRRVWMNVEKIGEIYRCNICGNEVTVTNVGGGTLVCSGQDMEKINDPEDISISRKLPDSGA